MPDLDNDVALVRTCLRKAPWAFSALNRLEERLKRAEKAEAEREDAHTPEPFTYLVPRAQLDSLLQAAEEARGALVEVDSFGVASGFRRASDIARQALTRLDTAIQQVKGERE